MRSARTGLVAIVTLVAASPAVAGETIDIDLARSAAGDERPGDRRVDSGEVAGVVPVDGTGWNTILFDPSGPFAREVRLRDGRGRLMEGGARFVSTLRSAAAGLSGVKEGPVAAGGDRDLMRSFLAWDSGRDGEPPDDAGSVAIVDLPAPFSSDGFDLWLYLDGEGAERVYTARVTSADGVHTRRIADTGTFDGRFIEPGRGVAANVLSFRALRGDRIEIDLDADAGRAPLAGLQIVSPPAPPTTAAIGINLYHAAGALGRDEWAGIVRLPRWNDVLVPGGFGTSSDQPGFGPVPLLDLAGERAGEISSTLGSYYSGRSGSRGGRGADAADVLLMSEYTSWDPPGDGVWPDDRGRLVVSGLGPAYTTPGYDVVVLADADRDDRTFSITVNGQTVVGSDGSTFDGAWRPARGEGLDANAFVFEDLTAGRFTLDVASDTGRAAVNAIQILPDDLVPPPEPAPPPPPPPGDGPNLVLFLVDDLGWQDTSVPFADRATVWNRLYSTPNLERLARAGTLFTDAYAASPVCSPTRVSLITGQSPERTRVSDWVGHGTSRNARLESADWASSGLEPRPALATLPALLRAAGYRTLHVGKAHFGQGAGGDPTRLGFDRNVAGSSVGSPAGGGAAGRYFGPFGPSHPGLERYGEAEYLNRALTTEALRLVDQAHEDGYPFYLELNHYAVHAPLSGQGDPALVGRYSDRPDPEDDYAALVESVDASLGRLLAELEKLGIARDTLVVFFSDNGGLSNHARASTSDPGDPWRRDHHNSPLRSGKGSAYEGGIRVPLVIAWAGQSPAADPVHPELSIPAGARVGVPVRAEDLFPTFLATAGVEIPPETLAELDGRDLSPLLRPGKAGDFDAGRSLFWHYPHQWVGDLGAGPGIEPFSAIRRGPFKAIWFYAERRWELYDLERDLSETRDLAADRPDVLADLGARLLERFDAVDATLPRLRAPLSIRIDAEASLYRDGRITTHRDEGISLAAGDEMPIVVLLSSRRAQRLPSDCNEDGDLDISDGICLLGHLFLGTPAALPCGDGTPSDRANIALLDADGDGGVSLADAVRIFAYLFTAGPPPVAGTRCVPIDTCRPPEIPCRET